MTNLVLGLGQVTGTDPYFELIYQELQQYFRLELLRKSVARPQELHQSDESEFL